MEDVSWSRADFRGLDPDSNFAIRTGDRIVALSGSAAVGYLRFSGAITDDVDPYYVWQHHAKFPIVLKICENVQDQKNSQLRGLTQRGVAQSDPSFARDFVDHLAKSGLVSVNRNGLVSATADGRRHLPLFIDQKILPDPVTSFLQNWR